MFGTPKMLFYTLRELCSDCGDLASCTCGRSTLQIDGPYERCPISVAYTALSDLPLHPTLFDVEQEIRQCCVCRRDRTTFVGPVGVNTLPCDLHLLPVGLNICRQISTTFAGFY
jgi:hypothetical protein